MTVVFDNGDMWIDLLLVVLPTPINANNAATQGITISKPGRYAGHAVAPHLVVPIQRNHLLV